MGVAEPRHEIRGEAHLDRARPAPDRVPQAALVVVLVRRQLDRPAAGPRVAELQDHLGAALAVLEGFEELLGQDLARLAGGFGEQRPQPIAQDGRHAEPSPHVRIGLGEEVRRSVDRPLVELEELRPVRFPLGLVPPALVIGGIIVVHPPKDAPIDGMRGLESATPLASLGIYHQHPRSGGHALHGALQLCQGFLDLAAVE